MNLRDFVLPKAGAAQGTAPRMHIPGTVISRSSSAILLSVLALLVACESNPAKPPETKAEPKGPELLTGRAAFQKVFIAARNYAADVKPFRIESVPTTDGDGHDGKSAVWRASFASPTHHGVKPFIWSGSNAPDAPSRGVFPAPAFPASLGTGTQPRPNRKRLTSNSQQTPRELQRRLR